MHLLDDNLKLANIRGFVSQSPRLALQLPYFVSQTMRYMVEKVLPHQYCPLQHG